MYLSAQWIAYLQHIWNTSCLQIRRHFDRKSLGALALHLLFVRGDYENLSAQRIGYRTMMRLTVSYRIDL